MNTILKDKLEYAYKSQRLEKQLLKEKSASLRRRGLQDKEICPVHNVPTKSHQNVKSKKGFQLANDINDITFHDDNTFLDDDIKVNNLFGDEFYKSQLDDNADDMVKNKVGVKEESCRRKKSSSSKISSRHSSKRKDKPDNYDSNVVKEPAEEVIEHARKSESPETQQNHFPNDTKYCQSPSSTTAHNLN